MAFYLILAIFLLVLDRFFKFLAINHYFDGFISVFGDIFGLSFAKNFNIAFSLPISGIGLNIVIISIVLGLIYYLVYSISKKEYSGVIWLLFMIFGAVSNLFDRLKYGFVVDYLDLQYFTVFNIADAMIVIGVAFLAYSWVMIDKNKKV